MRRRIGVLLFVLAALGLAGCGGAGMGGAGMGGAGIDGAGIDGAGIDGAGIDGAGTNGAGTNGAETGAWTAAAEADLPRAAGQWCAGFPQSAQQPDTGQERPPKAAALTFDDGPHAGTTDRLLDGLRERGVRASFFLVGEEAAGNRDLVRRMAAEGHQVGNHTWSHRRLDSTEREETAQEIGKTEALLEAILGGGGYWVRPPYGFLREGTEDLAGTPLVKWSVDPRDWESRNREKIVSAVLDAVEPGSIILLHDIYPSSVDAALDIADALQEQGYSLVTVEELLALYGRTPKAGEMIRSAAG